MEVGIWSLKFLSDKWDLSKTTESQGKRHFANHSLLSAPSGRIILLYVDELLTVSSCVHTHMPIYSQLLSLQQQAPQGLTLYTATVLLFKDKLLA